MIALIDNYDSFTYNLVQMLGPLGADIRVFRNDCVTVAEIGNMKPEAVIISPGPGTPEKAGISVELVRAISGHIPLLGVCLGHQAIGVAFGAKIGHAAHIMHGKTSLVSHDATGLYKGLKNPFTAGRYHSLALMRDSMPPDLIIEAAGDDEEIMGIRHREHPTFGVQFHPESILTPGGKRLLRNFLDIVNGEKTRRR